MMTGSDYVDLAKTLAPTIAAIAALIQGMRNGSKADAIHVLVNSGMTKALADVASAQEEVRVLRTLVTALTERINTGSVSTPVRLDSVPSDAVKAAMASTPKL